MNEGVEQSSPNKTPSETGFSRDALANLADFFRVLVIVDQEKKEIERQAKCKTPTEEAISKN